MSFFFGLIIGLTMLVMFLGDVGVLDGDLIAYLLLFIWLGGPFLIITGIGSTFFNE